MKNCFCSFCAFSPTYIKLNLEITTSESWEVAPGGHVLNTLKFLLKSDNSLFDSGVIVFEISSLTDILHFQENNSLNLSKIIVGKFDKFFKIKQDPPKMAFKKSPGLNYIIIFDREFASSSSLFFQKFYLYIFLRHK